MDTGANNVRCRRLTMGVVCLHIATKPIFIDEGKTEQQEYSYEYGFFYDRTTTNSIAIGHRYSHLAETIELHCRFLSDIVRRTGAFTTGAGLD
jgi:hypothetical protein